MLEVKQEALDRGLKTIRTNYENTAKRGGMKAEDVDKRMALITPTLTYDDLKDADVIIEAVFETMEVKEGVFKKLDEVAKPGAVLATNTSGLDVNQIATYTKRPGDVIGMHFFSPANVMKLLENVRGKATQKDVIATVMSLSKKIGKIPVLVGVCEGFVGNRMLRQRGIQSAYMMEEGALPQQIDKVIYDFGFPMGPFAMSDLAGNDVGWRIRQGKKEKEQRNVRYTGYVADAICELGRFGQKTGAGYFKYNLPDRTPIPDPEVEKIIEETSKKLGITRRAISDQEILERCLYPMVNEGAKILEEGMAQRSLDIDVIWVNGYGWPVYRGGPMWWADNVVGLKTIHDALLKYRDASGDPFWEPAPLLKKLVQEGKKFSTRLIEFEPGRKINNGRRRHRLHRPHADRQGVPRHLQRHPRRRHGRACHQACRRARQGRAGRGRGRDPGLRRAGRHDRLQRGARLGDARRRAGQRLGRHRQPLLLVGPADHLDGRPARAGRQGAGDDRGRPRVGVAGAGPAGRQQEPPGQSLGAGARAGHLSRHDHRPPTRWRRATRSAARRRTSIRCRASCAPRRASRPASSTTRSCRWKPRCWSPTRTPRKSRRRR